jgi:hypothetical protein
MCAFLCAGLHLLGARDRAMGFDRLHADPERRGGLFIASPFGDELNDLALTDRLP